MPFRVACLKKYVLPPVARKNGKTKSETYAFSVNFGRTDLLIGQSKAKNCEESAGDVRIGVAPQKPSKNMEKRAKFCDKKFSTSKNEMSGIARNAFSQSFVAIGADFEG